MKVKHYHKEYDSYKTERQWALEGFLVAENVEGIELLPSKQSKQPCKYYKPTEVRPATESELQAFFQPEKERRREQARAYRKARLEREQEERERELEEAKRPFKICGKQKAHHCTGNCYYSVSHFERLYYLSTHKAQRK